MTYQTIPISILRGCAKKKNQKIRDYYGSRWVGPGLTRILLLLENRPNHPKIPLNQYRYFGVVYHYVFCLYISCCIYIVKSC